MSKRSFAQQETDLRGKQEVMRKRQRQQMENAEQVQAVSVSSAREEKAREGDLPGQQAQLIGCPGSDPYAAQ